MLQPASSANNWHYNKTLKHRARELRNQATQAEKSLWYNVLQGGRLSGYEFLRQRPVLYYIADFFCKDLMLILELDGEIHELEEIITKDNKRQKNLEAVGFTVLRFSNWEALHHPDLVTAVLLDWIREFEQKKKAEAQRTPD